MIEYILKNVFSIFGKENVETVVYYGNKQGKDVDVFVITTGEDEYNCLHQNEFDITFVGKKHLNKMVKHFDPLITEPVLTGEVVFGEISQIKNALNKVCPSKDAVDYLMKKAFLYFQWANIHLQNDDLVYACDCVRFSLGFYYFATHYQGGGKIATFSTVHNESSDKCATIEKAKKMAKNKEILTFENVKNVLAEALKSLDKIFKIANI